MRVGIYARISRDRIGAGLGIDRQEQDCRALAAANNWQVVDVYADNDVSASSGKRRPEYLRLLADIERGAVDVVICWHTDRLHRRPVELEHYIEVCERRHVATHSVRAGALDLTTASGQLVARQLGAVARYETQHAVERIKAQKQQAAADGKWLGGPRPFGYESDGMTVNEGEAVELRAMTADLVAGISCREISRRLNDRGIMTATGAPWKPTRVAEVISRPRNAGLVTTDGPAARWPAVVDEQLWRGAAAILAGEGRRTNPGGARRWLGGGLYRCGVCEAAGVEQTMRSSTAAAGRRVYACDGPSKHLTRQAIALDAYIERIIVERLSRPDAADLFEASGRDIGALHIEANGLRARLDEAAQMFAAGDIAAAQLLTITKTLRGQLEQVDERIATGERSNALAMVAGRDAAVRWAEPHVSIEIKRAVLDTIMTVTVLPARAGRPAGLKRGEPHFDPATIRIEWKS